MAVQDDLFGHNIRVAVAVEVHKIAQQTRVTLAMCIFLLGVARTLVHHKLVHSLHLGTRGNHWQRTLLHIDSSGLTVFCDRVGIVET